MAIEYGILPESAQVEIDGYPEEQSFAFYYNEATQEVRAVADHLSDLLEAQGGMDEGWQEVVFGDEDAAAEFGEDPIYE